MLQLPAVEADLFKALRDSALDVLEVRAPAGGLSNIAYAKIRKQGAGDGKQALAVMLGASKMAIPKLAYVFDEDVDIWDDDQVQWSMAFRFDPIRDTVIIPAMNTMTVDPMINAHDPPATISKTGYDCTIPWGEGWTHSDFARSEPFVQPAPAKKPKAMSEAAIRKAMEAFIREQPRSWRDILTEFSGQDYRKVNRAFGDLRPRLGRVMEPPYYPYAFKKKKSDSDFIGEAAATPPASSDHLHQ
jgi:2,5-furandicarboxylate decarboxylase 1